MSPKRTSPPPDADANGRSDGGRAPIRGSGRRGRERAYRRVLATAMVASLLFHLVGLLVIGGWISIGTPEVSPRSVPAEPRETGLEVVRLPETPPPAAEPPEETPPPRRPEEETEVVEVRPRPEAEEPAETTEEEAAGPPAVGPPVEAEEGRLSNAERLQPRLGDERLWVDFEHPITGERAERLARADSALRAILRDWLDSLRLTEEQRQRAMDWTYRHGDQRWGISSEGLHLGDITIPIPFGALFQQGGPKAREARRALQDLYEIRRQEARHDRDEVLEERREEMRRRSREEAERREGEEDTTSVRLPGGVSVLRDAPLHSPREGASGRAIAVPGSSSGDPPARGVAGPRTRAGRAPRAT